MLNPSCKQLVQDFAGKTVQLSASFRKSAGVWLWGDEKEQLVTGDSRLCSAIIFCGIPNRRHSKFRISQPFKFSDLSGGTRNGVVAGSFIEECDCFRISVV